MGAIRELVYHAKLALLKLYGPPDLDPELDPIEQLKREHERQSGGPAPPLTADPDTTGEPDTPGAPGATRPHWDVG